MHVVLYLLNHRQQEFTTTFFVCLHLQEVTDREKIYPACLPTKQRSETVDCANPDHQCALAVNTGWSKPIPPIFLQNHAPNFLDSYEDFYKQYQYRMEVWKKCNQDENIGRARPSADNNAAFRSYAVNNPTNTYYPQGK